MIGLLPFWSALVTLVMRVRERQRGLRRADPRQRMMFRADAGALDRIDQRRTLLLRAVLAVIMLCIGLVVLAVVLLKSPLTERQRTDRYYTLAPECFQAPINPGDRRQDKTHLKVVNFNAEWLFLYGGRGGIRCPAESCPWINSVEALMHMKTVAELLARLDADVVHLSEVEDCRVLTNLLSFIPGDHGYAPYLIIGKDHATGQNVGMLTRVDPSGDMVRTEKRGHYPIPNSSCRRGKGTIGTTKHYVVPINVDNGQGKVIPFVFVGLHLLARPSDRTRCAQREGQAIVLRELVQSLSKNQERIIMMGDFNDYDELALGVDNRRPLTTVLSILYESSGSGRPLRNVAALIPKEERYTCWFDVNQNCRLDGNNERVMIDHILLDSELEVVEAQIHHGYNPACDSRISDHWPFFVKIKL